MADEIGKAVLSLGTDSASIYTDLEKLKAGVKDVAGTISQTSDAASSDWATMAKAITAVSKQLADQKAKTEEVRQGTQSAGEALHAFGDLAKEAAGALGVAFTIDAALQFLRTITEEAVQLRNLSLQTRISTDDLQVLAAATSDYGVNAEELGRALFQLQQRIAGGDSSVATAYHLMGISLDEVKNKNPMELFLLTERALGQLHGSIQDTAAADLFGGRLGSSMIAFSSSVDEAIDKARGLNHATEDSIKSLAEYSSAIDRAERSIKALATEGVGKIAEGFNTLTDAQEKGATKWSIFVAMLKDWAASNTVTGASTKYLATLLDETNQKAAANAKSAQDASAANNGLAGSHKQVTVALTAEAAAAQFMAATRADAVKPILDWQEQDLEQLKEWGALNAKNAEGLGVTVAQYDAYIARLQEEKTANEEANAAALKWLERQEGAVVEATKLWDEYSKIVVQRSGSTTAAQMADIEKWAADLTVRVQKAGEDTAEFYNALYAVIDAKQQGVLIDFTAIAQNSSAAWKQNLQDTADKAAATYQYMVDHADQFRADTIAKFQEIAFAAKNAADDWATSWNENLDKLDAHLDAVDQKQKDAADRANAATSQPLSAGGTPADPFNPLASLPLMVQYAMAGIPVSASSVGMPTRDSGGPVSAGVPYMIGRGAQPEMFVPSSAGSMIPAGGYGGVTVNLTVQGHVYGPSKQFQRDTRQAIEKGLRTTGVKI